MGDTFRNSFITVSVDAIDSLPGILAGKLDPFRIWFYAVVAIGYAKMFRSEKTLSYVITVFAIWIGFALLMFVISQFVPFLKNIAV